MTAPIEGGCLEELFGPSVTAVDELFRSAVCMLHEHQDNSSNVSQFLASFFFAHLQKANHQLSQSQAKAMIELVPFVLSLPHSIRDSDGSSSSSNGDRTCIFRAFTFLLEQHTGSVGESFSGCCEVDIANASVSSLLVLPVVFYLVLSLHTSSPSSKVGAPTSVPYFAGPVIRSILSFLSIQIQQSSSSSSNGGGARPDTVDLSDSDSAESGGPRDAVLEEAKYVAAVARCVQSRLPSGQRSKAAGGSDFSHREVNVSFAQFQQIAKFVARSYRAFIAAGEYFVRFHREEEGGGKLFCVAPTEEWASGVVGRPCKVIRRGELVPWPLVVLRVMQQMQL